MIEHPGSFGFSVIPAIGGTVGLDGGLTTIIVGFILNEVNSSFLNVQKV